MKPKLPNTLYRRQLFALAGFGMFIIIAETGFYLYQKNDRAEVPQVNFNMGEELPKAVLAEFNPNDLDERQWQQLGFSQREAATILKYKNIVGGSFKSKEQLKKCYSISAEKFAQISPYILLPDTNAEAFSGKYDHKKFVKRELIIPGKFNPDELSAEGWQKMGFSENQANAIIKYKNYLGGSFRSKEKLKQCFIISEENYQKMAPYILLPETAQEPQKNYAKYEKAAVVHQPFDPNLLNEEGWKKLGFSDKQAAVIVNYRERNMRGSFKNLEDIQKCFVINADKFEELKPYIRLNPENFKNNPAPAFTNNKPAETAATDFSKTDLNQITFKQLREFGFTEKDAAMLLSFRKKLGGFVNKGQVADTYEIDKNLASKLSQTAQLNPANVQKYSLTDAPEEWLKAHPYFKYSADKIIYYRTSEHDEKKIWKLLRLKPEYEQKMRMYLKD